MIPAPGAALLFDIARTILPDLPAAEGLAALDHKEAIFRDLAASEIHAVPGLFAFLDAADAAGLPMAAVTNAPRANTELILNGLGIAGRFGALAIGAELAHGKPHPMPYLEGLRLLGGWAGLSEAVED
ncbi:MAG: HAD hydrolase-like protein [Candidatus Devosia euplotis]|nr:HAD hydrolase-like protein [Candidatus Devosia euplotis]